MDIRHFFDVTRGPRRQAACGKKSEKLELAEQFGNRADTSGRCAECVLAYEEYEKRIKTCSICSEVFADGRAVADHEGDHTLRRASYVCEPLAFVVSTQGCYDSPVQCARVLAYARAELKKHFGNKRFDIQPSRYMLRKDGENSAILGSAHVSQYIVVEI